MTRMFALQSGASPHVRVAVRRLLQLMALTLSLFIAQQPTSLPVPPPDGDHAEPGSHGHSGPAATRHRVSNRTAQAPLLKRLPAVPTFGVDVRLSRGLTLARSEVR